MVTFDARGPGTRSSVWEADERSTALPAVDLSAASELIVIAASMPGVA